MEIDTSSPQDEPDFSGDHDVAATSSAGLGMSPYEGPDDHVFLATLSPVSENPDSPAGPKLARWPLVPALSDESLDHRKERGGLGSTSGSGRTMAVAAGVEKGQNDGVDELEATSTSSGPAATAGEPPREQVRQLQPSPEQVESDGNVPRQFSTSNHSSSGGGNYAAAPGNTTTSSRETGATGNLRHQKNSSGSSSKERAARGNQQSTGGAGGDSQSGTARSTLIAAQGYSSSSSRRGTKRGSQINSNTATQPAQQHRASIAQTAPKFEFLEQRRQSMAEQRRQSLSKVTERRSSVKDLLANFDLMNLQQSRKNSFVSNASGGGGGGSFLPGLTGFLAGGTGSSGTNMGTSTPTPTTSGIMQKRNTVSGNNLFGGGLSLAASPFATTTTGAASGKNKPAATVLGGEEEQIPIYLCMLYAQATTGVDEGLELVPASTTLQMNASGPRLHASGHRVESTEAARHDAELQPQVVDDAVAEQPAQRVAPTLLEEDELQPLQEAERAARAAGDKQKHPKFPAQPVEEDEQRQRPGKTAAAPSGSGGSNGDVVTFSDEVEAHPRVAASAEEIEEVDDEDARNNYSRSRGSQKHTASPYETTAISMSRQEFRKRRLRAVYSHALDEEIDGVASRAAATRAAAAQEMSHRHHGPSSGQRELKSPGAGSSSYHLQHSTATSGSWNLQSPLHPSPGEKKMNMRSKKKEQQARILGTPKQVVQQVESKYLKLTCIKYSGAVAAAGGSQGKATPSASVEQVSKELGPLVEEELELPLGCSAGSFTNEAADMQQF